ncbi:hypothetical protein G7Y89_g11497 [Cudoniella acicularis]|uniref:O-methyltransferase domain-containing protein n=1 Tax=Cudoniella acicularis TaxID=354080 RepID=A0A8H4RDK9_9HELO|nr:hypothetical protein G7Y89_g11497 [Cudoniella acicularis]
MRDLSRLVKLANTIQAQVLAIHSHLATSRQADPPFDGQAPDTSYDGIDDIKASALENLTELHDLLSTREILQDRAPTDFISRHALDRLGIYDAIPIGEIRTYEQISDATKRLVRILRRVMRHAITQRTFYEPQPDVVAHTQFSRLLTEHSKVRDYYGTVCQEVWPAATRTVDAQILDENPYKHKRYDNAMSAFASDQSYSLDHVIKGYDWASLGRATVVDVGGGIGTLFGGYLSEAALRYYDFIIITTPRFGDDYTSYKL